MRYLFSYDNPEAASAYLSSVCKAVDEVVVIFSSYVSPLPSTGVSEFRYGLNGNIVYVDLYDAINTNMEITEYDEFIFIGDFTRVDFPHEQFSEFSSPTQTLIKQARPVVGIKKEHVKKVRAADIANGFEWNGSLFQTREKDLVLINGRVTKILALASLGSTHPDFSWRTADNDSYAFTSTEFIQFAVAIDEFVEQKYMDSWSAGQ